MRNHSAAGSFGVGWARGLARRLTTGGRKGLRTVARPRACDCFDGYFVEGEAAIVTVRGDGSTALELYVYDQDGDLVAWDTDGTADCVARWVPGRSGRYMLEVVNRGPKANAYVIGIN